MNVFNDETNLIYNDEYYIDDMLEIDIKEYYDNIDTIGIQVQCSDYSFTFTQTKQR